MLMKEKEFETWQTTRQQGKFKFILIRGLLSWGIPMFVIMTFIFNRSEREFTTLYLVVNAAIWGVAGIAFGALMWHITENRFNRELDVRNDTSSE